MENLLKSERRENSFSTILIFIAITIFYGQNFQFSVLAIFCWLLLPACMYIFLCPCVCVSIQPVSVCGLMFFFFCKFMRAEEILQNFLLLPLLGFFLCLEFYFFSTCGNYMYVVCMKNPSEGHGRPFVCTYTHNLILL